VHLTRLALHPEVSIDVRVNVAQSAEEAKAQAGSRAVPVAAEPAPEAAPLEAAPLEAAPAAPEEGAADKRGKKAKA
jgi:large subunit ribosomal protein L9